SSTRHTMLLHEGLEAAVGLFRIFWNFVLQIGHRHSGRIGHCVGRLRNAQSEPFDVAVKFLRQTERGFQCRAHEFILFDGNKNGSETHDDFPLGFVARRACSYRVRSGRSKRSFIVSLGVSSCGLLPLYADSALGAGTPGRWPIPGSNEQGYRVARQPSRPFASLSHFVSRARCRWPVAAPPLSLAALLSLLIPPNAICG